MRLKVDIINDAYSRMRISGLTQQPSPEDTELALRRLEQMAREFHRKSICVGFKFEENPDLNSPSGVPIAHLDAFALCLAKRLLTDFGKEPASTFMSDVRGAFSSLTSVTAPRRETQYPFRMPRSKITNYRYGGRFNKFYYPEPVAPPGCETNRMRVDAVDDFRENFFAYLNDGEAIQSFTIEADTGLTIITSSNTGEEVLYRVRADMNNTSGNFRAVRITVATDTGRVEPRQVNFEVTELFEGSNNA